MKINHLKINGFGKFINKEIDFSNNLNIVYGLNESGKSTIQKCILGIIFGLSKSKTGKEESEYDKLYPWSGLDYSGKLKYTLDNNEKYEIFRDFNRKNPVIYDENKNDISDYFPIDKNKGILFFEAQTEVDEKLFLDTAITSQKNVKLDYSSQNNIIQKITNIISSGDETISYNQVLQKILKLQNEKIGSNRTTRKPMNKINNNILELEKQQAELKQYEYELEEILEEEKIKISNLEEENKKINLLRDMKEYLDSSKFQFAEVDFNRKLEEEYDERILDLKRKIDIKAKQNIRLQKKSYGLNYLFIIISIIASAVICFVFKNLLYAIPTIVFAVLNIGYIIFSKINNINKVKEKLKQIDELQEKIDKEIEILKESKRQKQYETQEKNDQLNASILKNEERLYEKYHGTIEEIFIEKVFGMEIEELYEVQNEIISKINNINLELNSLKIKKENIQSKLSNAETIGNNIEFLNQEKDNLDSLNKSFNLAVDVLTEAYLEMKEQVSPSLTTKLNKMIEKISNGKYNNLILDDEKGLCVELESGEYISCEKLSIGTIDEIYLSLRLSVLEDITNEKLPIILDEAFAYFDNERLYNFLEFLLKEYSEYQIIIFTCSNREIDIFNKIKIDNYNFIEL